MHHQERHRLPLVPGDITDFVVEHQLNADISKESRTVHVEVAESADLSRLELLRFSVSEGARCDDLTVGETLDLSKPVTVHVKTYQDYVWTIYATVRVSTAIDVNAWADHAVFTVPSEGSVNPGIFEWRKEGESDWAASPEITPQAGLYVYEAGGLKRGTNYVKVLCTRNQQRRGCLQHRGRGPGGQHELRPVVLRDRLRKQDLLVPRSRRQQRQDLGFGQQGRALHRTRMCHHSRGGVRGRLRRRQAGRANAIHVPEPLRLGRFAAGNLLTGEFLGTVGSGPNLGARMSWGTPFTSRPSALKGWYAYSPEAIDHDDMGKHPELVGAGDTMQILVMLGDWDEPCEINTAEGKFIDQENDPTSSPTARSRARRPPSAPTAL